MYVIVFCNSLYECNDHKVMSHTQTFASTNIAYTKFFISDIVSIPIIKSTSSNFNIFVCITYIQLVVIISMVEINL